MSRLFNGQPAGTHANSALPHNKVNAVMINTIENYLNDDDNLFISLKAWIQSHDTSIQFTDDPTDILPGVVATPLTVEVAVTDSTGVKNTISPSATEVTVNIFSDGTGGAQVNGGAGPLVVILTNGVGTFSLEDGGSPGAVVLSLTDSGGSGLDVSDLLTVNFV